MGIIFIPSSYCNMLYMNIYVLAHTGGDGVTRSLLLRHYHLHKEKIFFFCAKHTHTKLKRIVSRDLRLLVF
jgi:hypothetical protein